MKKKQPSSPTITANDAPNSEVTMPTLESFTVTPQLLWGLTATVAFVSFILFNFNTGFYQQDEAAHFVSMLEFWNNPNSILSNWAKPGYKLVYAVPALFGKTVVALLNSIFAAASCYLAYKMAEKMGSKLPLLAFLLLATQPLWISLSFRNYSEVIAAFLLIILLYLYLNEKYIFSALFASYICFIRQEFYPFLGLYFLWLAYRKQFVPAILLWVFPLVHHAWGVVVTGDWLYLLHQIVGTSTKIGDAYPRAGFQHYFRFFVVIYGSICTVLLVMYLSAMAVQRKRPNYVILLPVLLYFLMYCIFNIQTVKIGPSSAGNLRYLIIIAPLIAVFAALGVEEYQNAKQKVAILAVAGLLTLLVAVFMTYDHNFIKFNEEVRDWKPLIGVFFTVLIVLFPLTAKQYTYSLGGIALFIALITFKALKMTEEDKMCQSIALWYEDYEKKNGTPPQVIFQHDMISYFLGKPKGSFKPAVQNMDSVNVEKAPKGSLMIWDSHYSYRPELRKTSIQHTFFLNRPEQYNVITELITQDQRFGVLIVYKK
jgi:hypothetical protein